VAAFTPNELIRSISASNYLSEIENALGFAAAEKLLYQALMPSFYALV
jgi:hypothetical protein